MDTTSIPRRSLILVPSARRHFAVARDSYDKGDGKSLSKNKITKDSAVDAELCKHLAESIKTVSRRVTTIKSSFEVIKQTINDPLLDQEVCHSSTLVVEWSNLQEDFNTSLQNSSKVAKDASAVIRDFLLVVIPYLMDDSDIKTKQKELGDYRSTLERGASLAFAFTNNFKEISFRVRGFKKRWVAHTDEVIDELATEIQELEESISRTDALLVGKAHLKTLKKIRKAQDDSKDKVVKHTDGIDKGTTGLFTVHDDLHTITSQLSLAESGTSKDLFRKRLLALEVQYRDLWNSLQKYSSATDPTSSSGNSFFTKFLRQIGK